MPKRRDRLAELGYKSYAAYMRSDRWAATKARYRASKMPQRCKVCDSYPVDLHHRSYARVGTERLHDLVPLCRDHHKKLHVKLATTPRDRWWKVSNAWVKRERKRLAKAT